MFCLLIPLEDVKRGIKDRIVTSVKYIQDVYMELVTRNGNALVKKDGVDCCAITI